jgi:hypothetical protein
LSFGYEIAVTDERSSKKRGHQETLDPPRVENDVVLLAEARNNVTLRTMAIVHLADVPDSRDQKKAGARKRENADGAGDKMKCNGSHSTATDRSFFQANFSGRAQFRPAAFGAT